MDAILTSIYALYNADTDLKAALVGGLHLELAPQSVSYPYTVFSGSSVPDYYFQGSIENPTIDFSIYALTNATRTDCFEKLTAVFDDVVPSATGYTGLILQREFVNFLRDGDQYQIFRADITYRGRYQKT